MEKKEEKVVIIMAEDDEDDREMVRDASMEAGISLPIRFVENGEELMDLLLHQNQFYQNKESLSSVIILLDLNMPKLDGRVALKEIKKNESLRKIPVLILTTSSAKEDIEWAYNAGANSFIIKPFNFDAMVDIMKTIKNY